MLNLINSVIGEFVEKVKIAFNTIRIIKKKIHTIQLGLFTDLVFYSSLTFVGTIPGSILY